MTNALSAWNPWWTERAVPPALAGRRRRLTGLIERDLDGPEVLALTGIRRSGKTTIMYQLIETLLSQGVAPQAVLFAYLEDPGLDALDLGALADAMPAAQEGTRFLFLDEVQSRPGWERWVRVQIDQKATLKIIVSGSSSDLTRGDYARLLTGRNLTYVVRTLDLREFAAFHHAKADDDTLLDQYMAAGGFPEAALRDRHRGRALLAQYFRDIIHRDLVARRRLDPERVERLAVYLARAFGGPHTKRRIADAVHLAPDTMRAYLEAMQDAYLIHLVPRFTDSPKPSRETEAPFKVYWADTGLRNSVVPNPGRDRGTQAENLVANAFIAQGRRPFYWTDGKGRHEIDFLVPQPDGIMDAYQVWHAAGQTWDQIPERELTSFDVFGASVPRNRQGRRVLITRALAGQRGEIEAVPLQAWLTMQAT